MGWIASFHVGLFSFQNWDQTAAAGQTFGRDRDSLGDVSFSKGWQKSGRGKGVGDRETQALGPHPLARQCTLYVGCQNLLYSWT